MSTLTVHLRDEIRERLESVARVHGRTLEQEINAAVEQSVSDERMIEFLHSNPDELLRQVETHHSRMHARGAVPLTDERLRQDKNEGRE
jgi:predicted DNA-binding protein